MIMAANRFGQRNLIEVDFSAFDSEVLELIDALALVPLGTPEFRRHLAVIFMSQTYQAPLCERYNQFKRIQSLDRERLLRDLAKRNAKGSRFKYDSLDLQTTLEFDDICVPRQ